MGDDVLYNCHKERPWQFEAGLYIKCMELVVKITEVWSK